MNIRRKIQNRIKNRKGMSIGEVLFSVLIMLLATSVVVTTVSLAISNYLRTLSGSEANVLASTLESLMTSELAYTTEIHVNGTTVTEFQSQNYTNAKSLSMFVAENGRMMIAFPDDSSVAKIKLLGDESTKGSGKGAYPNGLNVSMDPITYTYSNGKGTFTITLTISRNGSKILDRTFNVINVNNTEPTNPAT